MSPPRVNPLIPQSVGALLAEEWTIDPHSTLPSFLEMTMVEEAQRSGWETLKFILAQVQHRLDRWIESVEARREETSLSFFQRLVVRARVTRVVQFFSENLLAAYGPEIRFLIAYWLERRSLLSAITSATISEALHGGRRVKLTSPNSTASGESRQAKLTPMRKQDGIRLALLLALGRYLTERGDWLHQRMTGGGHAVMSNLPLRVQKLFRFIYPFLYTTGKGLNLLQRWRYLVGQSVFFDPYSQWLHLVVRRVVADDAAPSSSSSTTPVPLNSTPVASTNRQNWPLSTLASPTSRKILMAWLTSALGISWLARLQTMRSELRQRRNPLENPTVSPPQKPILNSTVARSSVENCPPTHCPLCRLPRINPTASTSGYVFCLTCLVNELRRNPVCPLTGKACPETNVIRLFEPHSL